MKKLLQLGVEMEVVFVVAIQQREYIRLLATNLMTAMVSIS